MALERLVLRLDPSILAEREILTAYESVSRARRQEWLRSVIRAGMACAGQTVVVPQLVDTPAPQTVPASTNQVRQSSATSAQPQADTDPSVVAEAPITPARTALLEPVAAPVAGRIQTQPVEAPVKASKRSSSVLKGFLPESSAASAQS